MQARVACNVGRGEALLWSLMRALWPDFDRYQQRTRRQIPVVVLELSQPGKG
jgi:hypothetical protein